MIRGTLLLVLIAACGPRATPAATTSGAPACAAAPCPRSGEGAPESLSGDAVPRFFPNYTKPCTSTKFATVMKDAFNPSLSQMSDALFHDLEAEDRMDRVADAAAVILGCAEQIDKMRPPGIDEREWVTFDHFLIQLVMNTHALQTAALEDEEDIVVHWYHHVKQTCAGCHARFREE